VPRSVAPPPIFPDTPPDTITFLSDFIEFSEAGSTELIEQLLREIQVQSARLRSTVAAISRGNPIVSKANLEEYLKDTAGIHAMAGAAFDYFRQRSISLPREITWDRIKESLRPLNLHEENFPDLYSGIHRDEQNGISPNRWFRSWP